MKEKKKLPDNSRETEDGFSPTGLNLKKFRGYIKSPHSWKVSIGVRYNASDYSFVSNTIKYGAPKIPRQKPNRPSTLKACSSRFISLSWFPLEKYSSALTVTSVRFCCRALSRAPSAWRTRTITKVNTQRAQSHT